MTIRSDNWLIVQGKLYFGLGKRMEIGLIIDEEKKTYTISKTYTKKEALERMLELAIQKGKAEYCFGDAEFHKLCYALDIELG